ncbi:MAG: phosphatidylinositol-specific phospholipase C/glycerophosphodiester phosphodiesterase family protein [Sediminibacterium sp.]
MNKLFFSVLLLNSLFIKAQPSVYTTSNAHSHNDYEQPVPFWEAYKAGFGSIEADIFLVNGNDELLVAHTPVELLTKKRRLDSLYLIPIRDCIKKNNGYTYSDKSKKLQILIDIKTVPVPTLKRFIETIKRYPELTNTSSLQFVISGGRPTPDSFTTYPSFIWFDGELDKTYSPQALTKIVMMSDYLKRYTLWSTGKIPEIDSLKLKAAVEKSHLLKKPVRFWDAPDNVNSWHTLMHAGVDFINTDKIQELSKFLGKPY